MSDFKKHTSEVLIELYKKKSYQGANPVDAKIIFVGRDANWAEDIHENEVIFNKVVEYLEDGVSFWQEFNHHHPFLLENYNGNGKRYHKSFAKLGLDNTAANNISFVELIGSPTTGMATKKRRLYNDLLLSESNNENLEKLDSLLKNTDKKIFIAWGLLSDFKLLYQKKKLFKKLAELDKGLLNINDLNEMGNIYIHRHFSDAISTNTLEKMKVEVKKILID